MIFQFLTQRPAIGGPYPKEVRTRISELVTEMAPTELSFSARRLDPDTDELSGLWEIVGRLPNGHVAAYKLVTALT